MDNDDAKRRWRSGETALGGLLVLLGILVLAGQAVDVEVGEVGWPFFVIVPGLGLLGLGVATDGRLGEVLAMAGGLISVNGLVLGVQNATDRFDTWAYAWTLVFLVGPGIGRWLVGVVRGRRELAASGGLADRGRAGRVPGVGGGLRGGGRDRRRRLRGGWPLWAGGAADRGRPGPGGPTAAGDQAAVNANHGWLAARWAGAPSSSAANDALGSLER